MPYRLDPRYWRLPRSCWHRDVPRGLASYVEGSWCRLRDFVPHWLDPTESECRLPSKCRDHDMPFWLDVNHFSYQNSWRCVLPEDCMSNWMGSTYGGYLQITVRNL